MSGYPIPEKNLSYGLLGGLVGALVMGAIASMMPVPNTGGAPFFVAVAMMMGMGTMALVAGWILHITTGIIVGAIFAALVSKISRLRTGTAAKTVGLGTVGGIVVWVVFFMLMMAMLMPALMSMGDIVAGSFLAHSIYGLVLGGVVGALSKGTRKLECEVCGGSFNTREELMNHAKEHEKSTQQFACKNCGSVFKSEAELMAHANKAHTRTH